MIKKFIFVPKFGSIRLKLENRNIIATSVPEEVKLKFKEKYPDGVVGDALDFMDEKKLGEMLTKLLKSLQ